MVRPVKPDTIAKSLAIGNPADGPYVLDIARRTGGAVEDVNDEQIVDAIKLLARTEGIFAETAGGVTVGVTAQAHRDRACSTPPLRPSCSTPATASRRWTRWRHGDRDVRRDRSGRSSLAALPRPQRPASGRSRSPRRATEHRDRSQSAMSVTVRIPTILRTYTGGRPR